MRRFTILLAVLATAFFMTGCDHPHHNDSFLRCVRHHESDTSGGYVAQNKISTASGAYQFVDGTWRTSLTPGAHRPPMPGGVAIYQKWRRAKFAPPVVQDAVAWWLISKAHPEFFHWAGSHCGHGT